MTREATMTEEEADYYRMGLKRGEEIGRRAGLEEAAKLVEDRHDIAPDLKFLLLRAIRSLAHPKVEQEGK